MHWCSITGSHYTYQYNVIVCCTGTIVLQAHSGVFTNTVTNNLKIIFILRCQQSQVQSVKCEGEDASDNKHLNQSKMQKVHVHV